MKTSKEYAKLAFETADNGGIYHFEGWGISLRKDNGTYLLNYDVNLDEVESPIVIESKEQLAEEILYLIPCEESNPKYKEYSWWDNVIEEDKEEIIKKFSEKMKHPDGCEFKCECNEFYTDIRINGRSYACTVCCEVATTGYWYYGDTIEVKRVR